MSYNDLFQQRGNVRVADVRISDWFLAPENIDSADSIARYDKSAARTIEKCKALINDLMEYRQALTARYGALVTMASKKSIFLQRRRKYDGKIMYYMHHYLEYEDGTKIETETETFTGKERAAALKRFEELKKSCPGIETKIDIEKKSWEK